MLKIMLAIIGLIAYVGVLFFIAELCGFNKIDDEH